MTRDEFEAKYFPITGHDETISGPFITAIWRIVCEAEAAARAEHPPLTRERVAAAVETLNGGDTWVVGFKERVIEHLCREFGVVEAPPADVDRLAEVAFEAWIKGPGPLWMDANKPAIWGDQPQDVREDWRAVVRAVLAGAAGKE